MSWPQAMVLNCWKRPCTDCRLWVNLVHQLMDFLQLFCSLETFAYRLISGWTDWSFPVPLVIQNTGLIARKWGPINRLRVGTGLCLILHKSNIRLDDLHFGLVLKLTHSMSMWDNCHVQSSSKQLQVGINASQKWLIVEKVGKYLYQVRFHLFLEIPLCLIYPFVNWHSRMRALPLAYYFNCYQATWKHFWVLLGR